MITANIKISETGLLKVFDAEEKRFKTGRAGYNVRKDKNEIVISIKAKDFNAFKSVVLSILKLVELWFNIKQVIGSKI